MAQIVRRSVGASACVTCRSLVLRSFIGIPVQAASLSSRHLSHINQQTRLNSTIGPKEEQSRQLSGREEPQNAPSEEDGRANGFGGESVPLPWYLQVNSPQRIQPISKHQEIPELPESPPDILEPLLQQLSVDLGLDDLTLLDLRSLDPPPALGANLLMILGTARSEKHLHVSADRLCRWLRSTYQLRPDADGLLGRNELKLKLKRKARRAKMIGSGSPDEDADDGIRTGWVCVNIGNVHGPINAKTTPPNERFIGFGRQTEGVKIVVQMLTEEKRVEIDLEHLWAGIAKRQKSPSDADSENASSIISGTAAPNSQIAQSTHQSSLMQSSVQSRQMHTSSRSSATSSSSVSALARGVFSTPAELKPTGLDSLQPAISHAIESGDFNTTRSLLLMHREVVKELQGDGWRPYMLQSLKRHLESLPPIQARDALGTDSTDLSTPFLVAFHQAISRFSTQVDWDFRIWLYSYARRLHHGGYATDGLATMFENIQLSGNPLPSRLWLEFLRAILSPCGSLNGISDQQLDLAAQVLQYMEACGKNIMTQEVFVALVESLALYTKGRLSSSDMIVPHDAAAKTYGLPIIERSSRQSRLVTLLLDMQVPFTHDMWRIRLLNAFADQADWESFWVFWRTLARRGIPRSAALYACMFHRVAGVAHQKACMTVLRNWIPEMELEDPAVDIQGDVCDGIEACLDIIDPSMGSSTGDASHEWATLWKVCRESREPLSMP